MSKEVTPMEPHMLLLKSQIENSQRGFDGGFWSEAAKQTIPSELIPNPRKWLHNASERLNPEGVVMSGVISVTAVPYMLSSQYLLSAASYLAGWEGAAGVAKTAAIGGLAIANVASILVESRSLRNKHFSASPAGTLIYTATGKARTSSIAEHIFDHAQLAIGNPLVEASVINNDPKAFVDGMITVSAALVSWNLFWNTLIADGKVDPVVAKLKPHTDKAIEIKNNIVRKIRHSEPIEINPGEEVNLATIELLE